MQISDLKRIVLEQAGSLSPSDLDLLIQNMPEIQIGIKYGYGPWDGGPAKEIKQKIENNIKENESKGIQQYVRDVFIPHGTYDKILDAFSWKNPFAI